MSNDMKMWSAAPEQVERFVARTGLAPAVVVDAIVDEIVGCLAEDPQRDDVYETLRSDRVVDYVTARSAIVFENNDQFRRKMLTGDPRPAYYSFVRHWLAGVMQADFPEQLRRLPAEFCVGVPARPAAAAA